MKSNIETAQVLEELLFSEYGTGIAELRDFAHNCGVQIHIQADGVWISRPGYSYAKELLMPMEGIDRPHHTYEYVRRTSNELWSENDPIPAS